MSVSKFWMDGITLIKYWQVELTRNSIQNFEPDMKYWQIKHTGWINPSFEPDMKYWQIEHTGRFLLKVFNQRSWTYTVDGITLYVQIVCSSCLVQNFWMETPCMFSLSTSYLVEQFWMRSWTYTVIPSKFWTRHEKQTSWIYRVIPSKSFEPDMKYWRVEHKGW
jgi:hypothetical protein